MEDGDETADEILENDEAEEFFSSSRRKDEIKRKICCPTQRIEELATPNKRIFLALWNQHAYHLPTDKVKNLKKLLQQLYAMTPEETAKYFEEMKAEAKAAEMRKKLKQKLRKFLMQKHHQKQKNRAYKLFKRLLRCGIAYAAENPVPPLVSIRLRYLSDIILEQLCDLRKVVVPLRSHPDKLGLFLISVADWIAIAVERLYYAAQLSMNEIIDNQYHFSERSVDEPPKTYEEFGQPLATSSSVKLPPMDETAIGNQTVPYTYEEMGQPLASSTQRRISTEPFEPLASSTQRRISTEPSEPIAPSMKRKSSIDPFQSYMMATTLPIADRTPTTKGPHYTFQQMAASMKVPANMNKSKLEMPSYKYETISPNKSSPGYDKTITPMDMKAAKRQKKLLAKHKLKMKQKK